MSAGQTEKSMKSAKEATRKTAISIPKGQTGDIEVTDAAGENIVKSESHSEITNNYHFGLPSILIFLFIAAIIAITSGITYYLGRVEGNSQIQQSLVATVNQQETVIAEAQHSSSGGLFSTNLLMERSFESGIDSWDRLHSEEIGTDGEAVSSFPDDAIFPGTLQMEVVTDAALTGESSLRVRTILNRGGDYKNVIMREAPINGNSITIYVKSPDLGNIEVHYIQLCIPIEEWYCSHGTKIQPNEWTPITLDLSQTNAQNIALYRLKLSDVAIQWRYYAEAGGAFDLYVDSMLITTSGP